MSDSELSSNEDLSNYFEFETRGDLKLKKLPIKDTYVKLIPINGVKRKTKIQIKHEQKECKEPLKFCIFCAEKHGLSCPKRVCSLCHKKGHNGISYYYSVDGTCTTPKNTEGEKTLLDDCNEITNDDIKKVICMVCGKLGHTSCKETYEEFEIIPWKPIEEYNRLDKIKQERNEIIDIDPNECFGEFLEMVGNRQICLDPLNDEILERKRPKFMKRLSEGTCEIYCCKCGGDHFMESCNGQITKIDLNDAIESSQLNISDYENETLFPH